MEQQRNTAAPLLASTLLILLIYIGSYFALVVPPDPFAMGSNRMRRRALEYRFRWVGDSGGWVYWPLIQIDRKVRREPVFWERT